MKIHPLLLAGIAAMASRLPAQAAPQLSGQVVKGIQCDAAEGQRIHIHQHLSILDHGKPVAIPAFIGIPPAARCIYWLHTHTPDGIIHVEAPVERSFTLGDFFAVWGKTLDRQQAADAKIKPGESVRAWVNGKVYTGDPAKIPLLSHTDVTIEVGPPFSKPKLFTNWGQL